VQVEVNPPSTFGGHALHALSPTGRSQLLLQGGLALVVVLVRGLERSPVNKTWEKPHFV
jgi:hypothetical protein